MNFIDLYIKKEVEAESIHDFIEIWHTSFTDNLPLYAYLGMTYYEYAQWVANPSLLSEIINRRI